MVNALLLKTSQTTVSTFSAAFNPAYFYGPFGVIYAVNDSVCSYPNPIKTGEQLQYTLRPRVLS